MARLRSVSASMLLGVLAVFLLSNAVVSAQATPPDAPTDVAVYSIESQKLEVRWSTADASNTTSFKVQWKSGSQDFDAARQLASDPSSGIVSEQSTTAGDRYVETLSGLSNGAAYTVRVIATNANGDSDASEEVAGTPRSTPGQAAEFVENEVVEIFEDSHPWLRETWDYVESKRIVASFMQRESSVVTFVCLARDIEMDLYKCRATTIILGRDSPRLLYDITHELAHVFFSANGVAATSGPLGVAQLYFYDLVSPPGLGGPDCQPRELYADALAIVTHGDDYTADDEFTYWEDCELITSAVSTQVLVVVESAVTGDMPSWLDDTYDDQNGDPDLEVLWADVRAIYDEVSRAAAVYQMRDAFGGYCANAQATSSSFDRSTTGRGGAINPWSDGGCVPGAPTNVQVIAIGVTGTSVTWEEPLYDGGSAIQGYKIRVTSDLHGWNSAWEFEVEDTTHFKLDPAGLDLHQNVSRFNNWDVHRFRVIPYNQHGDGAYGEASLTQTPTDTTPPRLLSARTGEHQNWVHLIFNEELDESSEPPWLEFYLYVDGERIYPSPSIHGNIVTLNFAGSAITPDQVLTVSYLAPTGPTAKPLKDRSGNLVPDITDFPVRNDKNNLVVTSDPGSDNTYSFNSGRGDQDAIDLTATFSQPVVVTGVPEIGVGIDDGTETITRRARYHSGSGTNSLVFRYVLTEDEVDYDGVRLPSYGWVRGVVRYQATNAVAPAWLKTDQWATTIFSGHRVDASRPTLESANVVADGTDLHLRWSESMGEGSVPAVSDPGFEVVDTSDSTTRAISAIAIDGEVVTLTLATAVSATDTLTVSYEEPSANPVKDAVGNYANAFDATAVSVTQSANSPPEFPTTEDGARSVDESTVAGQNIGAPIAATDADSDPLTYSISGEDASFFDVVSTSGQLRTKEALDYETLSSYSFTMSVSDSVDIHGNTDKTTDDTIDVTVTVNDVDDPPRITNRASIGVDEDGSTDVVTFEAEDQDRAGTQWTYTMTGTDSADFTLTTGGVLTFNDVPTFEDPHDANEDNQYQITVNAVEVGDSTSTASLAVTVKVRNLQEEGVATPATSAERVGYKIVMGLTDGDVVRLRNPAPAWRWERSTNRVDWTPIRGAYSNTYTPTTDDSGFYLRATVAYWDGYYYGSGRRAHYVTSLIREVFAAPETPSVPSVSTGGSTSLVVTWTAPQAYPAITGYVVRHCESGSADDWTETDVAAGVLRHTITSLTSGTTYEVEVQATNNSGSSNWSQPATGTPTTVQTNTGGGGGFGPAPVAPKFDDGFRTKRDLPENAAPDDPIGDPVAATHPDDLAITYSISGQDAAAFTVNEDTGQLSMKDGMTPVMGNTYTVNLTATDSAGFGAVIIVTVQVVEPAHHAYDANRNGAIDRPEVVAAISDYFNGRLTKEEVIELINLYFSGSA